MAVNIPLKGIPVEVYARLKSLARRNHRSITSEAIALIDDTLRPSGGWTPERLKRARLWRSEFRYTMATLMRTGRVSMRQACSACDCEYVALTQYPGTSLHAADQRVARAFPSTVRLLGG
jgi:hypothetical protein